jgi:hypothetical protein
MAVDSKHPLYAEFREDWQLMRDSYRGERVVKEAGTKYLPPTSGQVEDGMVGNQPGRLAYEAYRLRAHFPSIVADAIQTMIGVMHHKPPTIELPEVLEPLREAATVRGESLEILLRRINEEQLVTGRSGLLLDVDLDADLPYIAPYIAEHIINWDDGTRDDLVKQNLNLVVLEETEFERQTDFEWDTEEKFRVLVLGEPDENEPEGTAATYQMGIFRDRQLSFNPELLITPSIRGVELLKIPFVFINSKDTIPDPDDPPLMGLSQLAMTIYRGEADYRQALFMQGQDTLVVVGTTDENFRVGANATIKLPIGGSAEYIGVSATGLPEMRVAIENDMNRAMAKGGQLLDTVSRERESGEALQTRVAAKTATLNQIALAGAFGLEQILRIAAEWVGADPETVVVTPNLDFTGDQLQGKTLVEYMAAKSMGAPFALQSIHKIMQEKDLTELDFEEELALIAGEEPLTGSTNPEGPEDDDEDEGSGEPAVDDADGEDEVSQ